MLTPEERHSLAARSRLGEDWTPERYNKGQAFWTKLGPGIWRQESYATWAFGVRLTHRDEAFKWEDGTQSNYTSTMRYDGVLAYLER